MLIWYHLIDNCRLNFGILDPYLSLTGKENEISYEIMMKSRIDFDHWSTDLSQTNNVKCRKQFGEEYAKKRR